MVGALKYSGEAGGVRVGLVDDYPLRVAAVAGAGAGEEGGREQESGREDIRARPRAHSAGDLHEGGPLLLQTSSFPEHLTKTSAEVCITVVNMLKPRSRSC